MERTRYERYCEECRKDNELYRHIEWAAYS
jgi:hypothetical protein